MKPASVSLWEVAHTSPFSYGKAHQFIESILVPTFVFSIFYVIAIFALKAFMANRKPLELKPILIGWNGFLAVFSILGSYYMSKALLVDISNDGLVGSYCKFGDILPGEYGLWALIFGLSKLIEVGDTILLVLRKKPLIFLHWYHHMVTMNFAMIAYTHKNGINGWMCWMNYTVHALMYSYYFVASCGIRIPTVISRCVTTSQILQFTLTMVQMIHIASLQLSGTQCEFHAPTLVLGLAMEFSYLVLFGHFFYKAYVHNGGQKFKKQKQS